jgi:hypothetical protein
MILNINVEEPLPKEKPKKTSKIPGRIYVTPRIYNIQNKTKQI